MGKIVGTLDKWKLRPSLERLCKQTVHIIISECIDRQQCTNQDLSVCTGANTGATLYEKIIVCRHFVVHPYPHKGMVGVYYGHDLTYTKVPCTCIVLITYNIVWFQKVSTICLPIISTVEHSYEYIFFF